MLTRRQIYTLLIVISAGLMLGRIVAVNRTDMQEYQKSRFNAVNATYAEREAQLRAAGASETELSVLEEKRQQALANEKRELPFFCANDRSRWDTIRALVEPDMRVERTVTQSDGTERAETVWYAIDKVQTLRGWDTIDMVKHNNVANETSFLDVAKKNGKEVYTKVNKLVERFPVLVEKVTKLIEKFSGSKQGDVAIEVVEPIEQSDTEAEANNGAKDDAKDATPDEMAGYLYSSKPPLLPTLMAAPYALIYYASNGDLTMENEPFLIVRLTLILCNLLPLIVCWFFLSRLIERFGTTNWGRAFSVAFVCFGTFLSTFVVTLNNHIPGAVSVTIAFYCAVRIVFDKETRWRYYSLAGFFGAFAVACEPPALLLCCLLGLWLFWHQFVRTFFLFAPTVLLVAAAFFATNYVAHKTLLPAYSQPDWYVYKYEKGKNSDGSPRILDSYWKNPQGLDKGEEHRSDYVFHSTVGHHGLYSLTPVWALSLLGLLIWLFDRRYWGMALLILFTSGVVFAFYMFLPLEQRNYGGNTSALRWVFWLAPLWSVALVAAADQLGKHVFFRMIALACLLVSVMSVAYPVWNPWTMPWTYNLMEYDSLQNGWQFVGHFIGQVVGQVRQLLGQ